MPRVLFGIPPRTASPALHLHVDHLQVAVVLFVEHLVESRQKTHFLLLDMEGFTLHDLAASLVKLGPERRAEALDLRLGDDRDQTLR